ncbi:ABC transporter permease [Dyella sp. RRB7]|uniref:ABC transporter permease n=1 Tax=Dyella sp. RRB7 TaxID=2919502 RepID=UPI001FA9D33D|nr:ABC transporter permease [Dyella sp. RRB7]
MSVNLAIAIWRYRGFILGSVKRDFQSRYQNSLLGAAWAVVQPLAMIVVYTVIFAEMMRTRLPGTSGTFSYSIYLCSGLLTWGLFSEIVMRGQGVFLDNGNMIKKLNFPRICLPAISVLNALVNFSITFAIFIAFLLLTRSFPGLVVLSALPVLIVQIGFATGLGIIAGVLNVFFRDVGQFIGILLQFWFWFTPIVYSTASLAPAARNLIGFNPMEPIAQAYQGIFVYGRAPDWSRIFPVAVMALILCVGGLWLFRRRAGEMVDEL